MSTLTHDGFIAIVELDEDDGLFHGRVINTSAATLHFAGRSVSELQDAFRDTVEDYRAWCAERGVQPEKPYSGTVSLRLPPELHQRLATRAAQEGRSLNALIVSRLTEAA